MANPKTITAVIADDEPLLRHHLNRSLAEAWPQLEVVASDPDGKTVLASIKKYQPDIAFLDIRMPGLDGIAVAKALKKLDRIPVIIFITAYDEYAIKAFEEHAFDYLLKPLSKSALWLHVSVCSHIFLHYIQISVNGMELQLIRLNALLRQFSLLPTDIFAG